MTRARVSLCLIARDEARQLATCLASVAGAVDELVVADTGSCDDTPAIARAHGATVVSVAWTDDFAAARNAALAHAHGDWVLSLDADERLSPAAAAGLRAAVAAARLPALRLPIQNLGRDGRVETAHLALRLFRRLPAHRWVGRVHEQVSAARMATAALPIVHGGYAEPAAVHAKLTRNRRLLAAAVAEAPHDAVLRYHLASTDLALGDPTAAGDAAAAALALGPQRAPELRLLALDVLARARFAAGDLRAAEAACREALAARPDWIDARLLYGRICRRTGRMREAIVHLAGFLAERTRVATDAGAAARFPRLWTLGDEPLARAELALVHAALGTLGRARAEAERAAALAPADATIARIRTELARLEEGTHA